jgi:hypothetical protein
LATSANWSASALVLSWPPVRLLASSPEAWADNPTCADANRVEAAA